MCLIIIPASDTGKLMARYCIAFNTVKSFSEVKGSESMEELVRQHQYRVRLLKISNTLVMGLGPSR